MGLKYSPDSDIWTAIQGSLAHGWSSDEYVHKSFYTYPESMDAFHLLTGLRGYWATFGKLDSTKQLFIPESALRWVKKNEQC